VLLHELQSFVVDLTQGDSIDQILNDMFLERNKEVVKTFLLV